MNKKRTILGGAILVAVLMLGIGYAAINSVTLNITGSATADPNAANFKVLFDQSVTPTTTGKGTTTATITGDAAATMTVTGLTAKGDVATATYTIKNASPDLSANVEVTTDSISNTEYFKITSSLGKATLTNNDTTTVTVTVELLKTPVTDSVTGNIDVKLTATPAQP